MTPRFFYVGFLADKNKYKLSDVDTYFCISVKFMFSYFIYIYIYIYIYIFCVYFLKY